MIHITVESMKGKITIQGHARAEENPEEYRAICTGISVLAECLMWHVGKFADKGIAKSIEYTPEEGDTRIRIWPEEWARKLIAGAIKGYADGMEYMALSHPECIEMIYDGRKVKQEEEKGA